MYGWLTLFVVIFVTLYNTESIGFLESCAFDELYVLSLLKDASRVIETFNSPMSFEQILLPIIITITML